MRRNEESESFTEEEPCRCQPGRQCHLINCEFCELIPSCPPGSGLEDDPGETCSEPKYNTSQPNVIMHGFTLQGRRMEGRSVLLVKKAFILIRSMPSNANRGPSTFKHTQTDHRAVKMMVAMRERWRGKTTQMRFSTETVFTVLCLGSPAVRRRAGERCSQAVLRLTLCVDSTS